MSDLISRLSVAGFAAALLVFAPGCSLDSSSDSGSSSSDFVDSETGQVANGDEAKSAEASTPDVDAASDVPAVDPQLSSDSSSSLFPGIGEVQWLHTDVSGWNQTANLKVSFSGDQINLNYDKAGSWPAKNIDGTSVNANPWIFVNQGGTWYAATWEWLRPGQTSKPKKVVEGGHIGVSPLTGFRPRSGEVYGFMVSGLARSSARNVQERSNVALVVWP